MKRMTMTMAVLLALALPASAAVQGKEVDYRAGEMTMKGYLAWDDSIEGKRPGVLVVHEWWGLNDYARKRAKMLAELGYTALAVDMYGQGKQAQHPDTAGKFAKALREDLPLAKKRFLAGLETLKGQPTVNPEKIAAIGYCFGGGIVLEMARAGVPLEGVVSFHGSIPTETPVKPGDVKAKVLVLNGADDPFVTKEQIAEFTKDMERAGADVRVVNYPGAKHSFTNPDADEYGKKFDLPLAYNAEADAKSWQEMKEFLRNIFQTQKK